MTIRSHDRAAAQVIDDLGFVLSVGICGLTAAAQLDSIPRTFGPVIQSAAVIVALAPAAPGRYRLIPAYVRGGRFTL